jgi:putative ubiquitin-RnfH superfamily antitoxin RatB of RatAB toxin-antitoxin module
MSEQIDVELAMAMPAKQVLIALQVPVGSTVSDVIAASALARRFPDVPVGKLAVGIWGRLVEPNHRVEHGDRVEIYRPLLIDPREARRQLALAGRTMGKTVADGDGEG